MSDKLDKIANLPLSDEGKLLAEAIIELDKKRTSAIREVLLKINEVSAAQTVQTASLQAAMIEISGLDRDRLLAVALSHADNAELPYEGEEADKARADAKEGIREILGA